ncbi:hypothetical protein A6302_03156 [Methylobrevis pamukkalensis]|uniref:Bacterial extracellular solute-binding protein, family 3 n=1 Tax=Methylobrevis pamukkalensis TaxID=1439726 RepID=A0A1E3GZM7_9HYPH|nr:hypothetical protein A6302_03156 [Methylobrevis pamukkalensis]
MRDLFRAIALTAALAVSGVGPALAQPAPAGAGAAAGETFGEAIELVDPDVFRVCSDPRNLPFSNQAGEGFENKIAEFMAAKLGKTVSYTWFPMATGFVRKTLGEHRCDVIIGFAQGDELVQNTNAYYRTPMRWSIRRAVTSTGSTRWPIRASRPSASASWPARRRATTWPTTASSAARFPTS